MVEVYFMTVWNIYICTATWCILWPFGTVFGHLVHSFGMFGPRKIWQPCPSTRLKNSLQAYLMISFWTMRINCWRMHNPLGTTCKRKRLRMDIILYDNQETTYVRISFLNLVFWLFSALPRMTCLFLFCSIWHCGTFNVWQRRNFLAPKNLLTDRRRRRRQNGQ
jgi:hypothetical protein